MSRFKQSPGSAPALAAGVSLALFLTPWLMPLVGILASIWSPVPIVLVYRRFGLSAGRWTSLMAIGGAVMVFAFFPPHLLGLFFLYYAAIGVVLGEAPFWRVKEDKAMALAAVAAILVTVALLTLTGFLAGEGLEQAWASHWNAEIKAALSVYSNMNMEQQAYADLEQTLITTGKVLFRVSFSILVVSSLLMSWGNLLLARGLLRRIFKLEVKGPTALTAWKAPENLVWCLIGSGIIVVMLEGFWYWVGVNLLIICGLIYFFQGVAVVAFWMQKKNAPRLARVAIFTLLALEFYLALLVAAAGLFDMWFDFRRLKQKESA